MKIQNRDWVEIIPGRWKIGRISYMYHVQLGKMLQPEPKGIEDVKKPYLRSANLDWHGVKLDDVKEMWFSIQDLKKYKIEPGDILVSEGGDVGRTSFWDGTQELYIQNAINRLRPITEESNSKFLFYWFCFLKNHGLIDIICDSSTIAHYTAEKVKATQLVYPPFSEQTQIANFLDHKTGQIDRLIEQKEKLLKLLAEKRTAIITRAVTKGLDPNVEMKDSGIDWLGEIPKHWATLKLRYLGRMKSGDGITSVEIKKEGEYPVYGGNGLRGYYESYTHEGEYILIGRQGALCGNVNYAKDKFWASEHAVVVTKSQNVDLHWLGELLRIMDLNQYSVSAAQPGLAIDRIQNLYVPLPPLDEQINTSQFLKGKSLQTTVDSKIQGSINQLKEYREALITAAVTGQIDVRGEMDIRDNDSTLGGTNSHLEHPDVPFNEEHNAKI